MFLFISWLIHDSKFAERKMQTYINSILGPIVTVLYNKHQDIEYMWYIELMWNISLSLSLSSYIVKSGSARWHFWNQSESLEKKQKALYSLYSDEGNCENYEAAGTNFLSRQCQLIQMPLTLLQRFDTLTKFPRWTRRKSFT